MAHGEVGFALADGLGGHTGGGIASTLATERFRHEVRTGYSPADLHKLATSIHEEIRTLQQTRPGIDRMATTISAGIVSPSLINAVHCGDCRISVSRQNGIKRLTRDHTEVQKLLDDQKIDRVQARNYPRRNVLTSALGAQRRIQIDLVEFSLQAEDKLFITSDGLHDKILLRELLYCSLECDIPEQLVDRISKETSNRNPTDNYSIICFFV